MIRIRHAKHTTTILVVFALAACATPPKRPGDAIPDAVKLRRAMAVYQQAPSVAVTGELGTPGNPVRVLMPEGEREYLHRLRCRNGRPPVFERTGSGGFGPYGKILDHYAVQCEGEDTTITITMDMYHCVEETRAVAGFDIVPEIGRREKSECR